ncbi:MAG: DUF3298 domain-containing protein [Acidobacteriota bacterium]
MLVILSLLALGATPIAADQAAVISPEQADAALAYLTPGTIIRHHCAPCGDTDFTDATIETRKQLEWSDTSNLVEIVVNGEPIDLAYVYVRQREGWHNLALLIGMTEVTDVPRLLTASTLGNIHSDAHASHDHEHDHGHGHASPIATRTFPIPGHWLGTIDGTAVAFDAGLEEGLEATGTWGGREVYLELAAGGHAPLTFELWDPERDGPAIGVLAGTIVSEEDGHQAFVGTWQRDGKTAVPATLELAATYVTVFSESNGLSASWHYPRLPARVPGALDFNVEQAMAAARRHETFVFELVDLGGGPPDDVIVSGIGWEREEGTVVAHVDDKVLSLERRLWSYTGGAHGNLSLATEVYAFTPAGPRRLALADLFAADTPWQDGLIDLVYEDLRGQGASLLGSRDEMTLERLGTFAVEPEHLRLLFQPYEVGSWAEGSYTVTVPWSSLRDWLAPHAPIDSP